MEMEEEEWQVLDEAGVLSSRSKRSASLLRRISQGRKSSWGWVRLCLLFLYSLVGYEQKQEFDVLQYD